MKKGIIFLFVFMLTASMVFAEGTKAAHGPTAYVPQAEIGSRAIGDDCTDPIVISIPADLPYSDLAQTTCGRGNSYDVTPLGSYDGGEDIIYRLDVTADVLLDFEMIPDVNYTGLLVADACPDVGAAVAMGTAYSGSIFLPGVELLAGNSYYVMVDTWPTPDCIPAFDLNIAVAAPPPANDFCVDAEAVGEVTGLPFNTSLATASGFGTFITSQDLWYVYTATGDGTLYVGLCGSSFDTKLALYGECDDTTLIDSNDDSCGLQSELIDVPVVAGEDYFIQVGGYGTSAGAGLLDIAFTPPPPPPFIQVGSGTLTAQSLPIEPFYGYSYSNVIYLTSEINTSGDITGLQYQYQTTAGFGPDDIVIYMGHTTQANFVDGADWVDNTTMTEVFNGQLTFPVAAGDWITIPLTTAFTYNGTDNLVIAWDENTAGYHSGSDEFFCTATTDIRGICYYSDGTNPDPLAPPTANAVRNSYANVRLEGLVPTNPPLAPTDPIPADLAVDVDEETNLYWSGTAATFYVYLWDDTDVMIVDGVSTTDNFFDVPVILDYATLYHWRIDAENVVGTTPGTEWSFTTVDPPPIYPFPFVETFDVGLPVDWEIDPVITGDSWEAFLTGPGHPSLTADHTGNGGYFMGVDDSTPETVPAHLYSPLIDLTGSVNPNLNFYYWIGDAATASTLNIDIYDGSTITTDILVVGETIDHWELGSVSLADWIGQTIIIDFRAMESTSFYGDICLDDVELLDIPAGGLEGYVYDTNGAPLEFAEVTCEGITGYSDATGWYTLSLVPVATADATASLLGYFDSTVSVTIVENLITTQDFYLDWAEIALDPTLINMYLQPATTDDQIITITNNGTGDLNYNAGLNFLTDRTYEPVIKPSLGYANPAFAEVDPIGVEKKIEVNSDALFDLQFQYPCAVATGEAGVETDGNYIYTTEWNGAGGFFRYNMDGTYVGTFIVAGAGMVRDLAYDGQYFYGAAANTSLFQMDFTPGAEVLVSTITAPVACRAIAYDPVVVGFWANNFSTDVTLFDMTGTVIFSFPVQTAISLYGLAYDDFSAGGPFLWGFSQSPANTLVQYDMTTGLETGVFFDVGALVGSPAGSAGGMFISDACVAGYATIGCLIQNEWIVGLELAVTETWMSITDPGPGVVVPGGTADVTVHFDTTDLTMGEVKTGEVVFSSNAASSPDVIPVTLTVGDPPLAPAVFFSEYIEGSSNNKALEIYNNTGAVINLDDFRINQSNNGGGWQYQHYFPAGATVADGDVWVILNDGTDPLLYDPLDADEVLSYPSVVHHNGNDARGIEWTTDGGTTWTLIDVFGVPTEAIYWDVAGVPEAAHEYTLVRKATVVTGNTDWALSAGTNATDSEWIVYPQNTFDYLGEHPSDPPVLAAPSNVFVDALSWLCTWDAPPVTIYTDDLESYTAGDFLAVQSADWTTWSNLPGSAEDALISNVQALSGSNSVVVEGTSDLVLIMDNYTTGVYSMELNLLVPAGNCGYWNLQKTNTIGQEWAFQIQFDVTGIATADAGAAGALTFPFSFDTWINMELVIDLDADWCEIWVDGVMMHGYQWTLGTFGTPGLLSLGGMNLYAWASAGNSPQCYFDDITFSELSSDTRDLIGYNVYLDSAPEASVGFDVFEYQYTNLTVGNTYMAGVSAVYDEGESDIVEYEFIADGVVLDPPTDLFVTELGYATWVGPVVDSVELDDKASITGASISLTNSKATIEETRDFTGFNVYLDGVFVVFITDEFYDYDDGTLVNGQSYVAAVEAVYDEGVSVPIEYTFTYVAVVLDPPVDVAVDDITGTVSWSAPAGEPIIYDNFDSFNVGDYIAVVGDNWTTWSGAPGGAEDAFVSDVQSYSPSNSVEVLADQDLVLIMEDYTTGIYQYDMKMFVPTGYCGYFNLQKTSTPGQEWAFQIYYQTDGTALADAGAAGALTHPFNHDEWLNLKVVVDLDNDWATYYFNDVEMIGYQWTLGTFGTPGLLAFGGVNIFGGANSTTTDTPMFYMDDVMISIPATRDLTGYNVYLDGVLESSVGIDVFDFTYADLVAGDSYTAGVSALYDDGESEIVEVDFVYNPDPILDPPVNLAVVSNPDDDFATFTWEAPTGGGEIEELIYDNGTSTGAYSYVGYSMGTQMSPSEACQVLTLKIHTSDGTDFNAEVWGWDAGAPTEDLYYQENVIAAVDDWVLVDVSGENLMFDGDFMVAFGSLNAATYMSYDAGLNNGRAWDHADAGGWSSWSEAYLVRAIVQYGDGRIAEISPTLVKTNNVVSRVLESGEKISVDIVDHNVDNSRDLIGYNVYLDGDLQGDTSDLFWEFTDLVNGDDYMAGVEAVYDEGISDLVEIAFTYDGTIAGDVIVAATKLHGNYPNPFNPVTNIAYSIKTAGKVTIEVYNIRGQLVKTLVNEVKETGAYTALWNGKDNSNKSVSSGVYFYKMKTQDYNSTRKMILMK